MPFASNIMGALIRDSRIAMAIPQRNTVTPVSKALFKTDFIFTYNSYRICHHIHIKDRKSHREGPRTKRWAKLKHKTTEQVWQNIINHGLLPTIHFIGSPDHL